MLRAVIVFLALSGIAFGQDSPNPVEVGFGIRGGLLANKSFQANQLCSGAGCSFGTTSFAADGLHGTLGPTVDVLLYDHVEIRFEAVHRRIGYQIRTDLTVLPVIDQHNVETTLGHLWEYPLLGTYHFSSGPVRPFVGGGLSLATTGNTNTETQFTQTVTQGGNPVTTTTIGRISRPLGGESPLYLVAGIDGRVSHISIRPEFRYSHFSGSVPNDEVILKPNQFEVLLSVSLQFRVKK